MSLAKFPIVIFSTELFLRTSASLISFLFLAFPLDFSISGSRKLITFSTCPSLTAFTMFLALAAFPSTVLDLAQFIKAGDITVRSPSRVPLISKPSSNSPISLEVDAEKLSPASFDHSSILSSRNIPDCPSLAIRVSAIDAPATALPKLTKPPTLAVLSNVAAFLSRFNPSLVLVEIPPVTGASVSKSANNCSPEVNSIVGLL